jgi:hypothetical protein
MPSSASRLARTTAARQTSTSSRASVRRRCALSTQTSQTRSTQSCDGAATSATAGPKSTTARLIRTSATNDAGRTSASH